MSIFKPKECTQHSALIKLDATKEKSPMKRSHTFPFLEIIIRIRSDRWRKKKKKLLLSNISFSFSLYFGSWSSTSSSPSRKWRQKWARHKSKCDFNKLLNRDPSARTIIGWGRGGGQVVSGLAYYRVRILPRPTVFMLN